ncbi:MAG: hypothetical protein F2820_07360 [Actinobacteria bacterium]|nr:hypothetical protein [Actinomycetota bacterium]
MIFFTWKCLTRVVMAVLLLVTCALTQAQAANAATSSATWVNPTLGPDGQRIGGWGCIRTMINKGNGVWEIAN